METINSYEKIDYLTPEEREQARGEVSQVLGFLSLDLTQFSHEDNENIILSQE